MIVTPFARDLEIEHVRRQPAIGGGERAALVGRVVVADEGVEVEHALPVVAGAEVRSVHQHGAEGRPEALSQTGGERVGAGGNRTRELGANQRRERGRRGGGHGRARRK